MTYALECANISKAFDGLPVLEQINLTMRSGQLVALLGPSGCGKTTVLRLLAGFEWPNGGVITINGRLVSSDQQRVPPEARRVGMVFQEYALFHHLNVAANIAFGLRGTTFEKRQRTAEMLALVGMTEFGERMPHELSGGQQQRIALARALAPRPDILLLDEPFSNLDAALRTQVRAEVRAILRKAGTTCLFVTHDQEEALSFADEVALLLNGRIVQMAPPQVIYQYPVSRSVAAFVGEANFLPGQAKGATVICSLGQLPICPNPSALHDHLVEGAVEILIRPEALQISREVGRGITGRVAWSEYYGHTQRIGLNLEDGTELTARADAHNTFDVDESVSVSVSVPVLVFPKIR